MQKKHNYYRIHIENNNLSVKTNKANRSTIVIGTPIFLSARVAWDWLLEVSQQIKQNYKEGKT